VGVQVLFPEVGAIIGLMF